MKVSPIKRFHLPQKTCWGGPCPVSWNPPWFVPLERDREVWLSLLETTSPGPERHFPDISLDKMHHCRMFQKCDENSCLPPICILTFKIGGLKAPDLCIYLHTSSFSSIPFACGHPQILLPLLTCTKPRQIKRTNVKTQQIVFNSRSGAGDSSTLEGDETNKLVMKNALRWSKSQQELKAERLTLSVVQEP